MKFLNKIVETREHMERRDLEEDLNIFYDMEYAVIQKKLKKETW